MKKIDYYFFLGECLRNIPYTLLVLTKIIIRHILHTLLPDFTEQSLNLIQKKSLNLVIAKNSNLREKVKTSALSVDTLFFGGGGGGDELPATQILQKLNIYKYLISNNYRKFNETPSNSSIISSCEPPPPLGKKTGSAHEWGGGGSYADRYVFWKRVPVKGICFDQFSLRKKQKLLPRVAIRPGEKSGCSSYLLGFKIVGSELIE